MEAGVAYGTPPATLGAATPAADAAAAAAPRATTPLLPPPPRAAPPPHHPSRLRRRRGRSMAVSPRCGAPTVFRRVGRPETLGAQGGARKGEAEPPPPPAIGGVGVSAA